MVEKKKIRLTPKLKAAALEYKEQLEQIVKDLNDVAKDVIPELEKNYNVECREHSGRPDKISLYRGNISGSYQLYATGDDAKMNINDASSILVEELENELNKSKINATVNTKFPVTWADAAVYVSINVIPPSEDIYNAMVAIVDKEEDKRNKELRKRSRYSWGYDESSSNFKIGDKFVDDTHENFGKIYTITSLGVDSYDLEDVNGTQVTRDANYIGTNMHMASKDEIEKTQFAPTMESSENPIEKLFDSTWGYVCSVVPDEVSDDMMLSPKTQRRYIDIVCNSIYESYSSHGNVRRNALKAVMDYYSSKQ